MFFSTKQSKLMADILCHIFKKSFKCSVERWSFSVSFESCKLLQITERLAVVIVYYCGSGGDLFIQRDYKRHFSKQGGAKSNAPEKKHPVHKCSMKPAHKNNS